MDSVEFLKVQANMAEHDDCPDEAVELRKAAAIIEKQDRLLGLYRLRETLRFHPAPEAAIRLTEVNEEIQKMEAEHE